MSFDTRLLAGVGVLAAVTEAGNFARASEMLGLTPSAVSRAVSRLEARVGVRLFAGAAVVVRGRLRVSVDPWFARTVLAS